MPNATDLVAQIRSDLDPLKEKIRDHSYLSALEAGQVQRVALRAFAGHQHHIISSDLRSIALLVSRHGALPSRAFLINTLQGEAAAMDAIDAFARALGLGLDDLKLSSRCPLRTLIPHLLPGLLSTARTQNWPRPS